MNFKSNNFKSLIFIRLLWFYFQKIRKEASVPAHQENNKVHVDLPYFIRIENKRRNFSFSEQLLIDSKINYDQK